MNKEHTLAEGQTDKEEKKARETNRQETNTIPLLRNTRRNDLFIRPFVLGSGSGGEDQCLTHAEKQKRRKINTCKYQERTTTPTRQRKERRPRRKRKKGEHYKYPLNTKTL